MFYKSDYFTDAKTKFYSTAECFALFFLVYDAKTKLDFVAMNNESRMSGSKDYWNKTHSQILVFITIIVSSWCTTISPTLVVTRYVYFIRTLFFKYLTYFENKTKLRYKIVCNVYGVYKVAKV